MQLKDLLLFSTNAHCIWTIKYWNIVRKVLSLLYPKLNAIRRSRFHAEGRETVWTKRHVNRIEDCFLYIANIVLRITAWMKDKKNNVNLNLHTTIMVELLEMWIIFGPFNSIRLDANTRISFRNTHICTYSDWFWCIPFFGLLNQSHRLIKRFIFLIQRWTDE